MAAALDHYDPFPPLNDPIRDVSALGIALGFRLSWKGDAVQMRFRRGTGAWTVRSSDDILALALVSPLEETELAALQTYEVQLRAKESAWRSSVRVRPLAASTTALRDLGLTDIVGGFTARWSGTATHLRYKRADAVVTAIAAQQGPTTPLPKDTVSYGLNPNLHLWAPGTTITWSNATADLSASDSARQARVLAPLSEARLQHQRDAFDYMKSFCNVDFMEVPDAAGVNLRCCVSNALASNVAGHVYAESIPANRLLVEYNDTLIDNYTPRTYRHEVGHVLKLKHPDQSVDVYGEGGDYDMTLMETVSHETGQGTPLQDVPTTCAPGDIIGLWHVWGSRPGFDAIPPDVPTAFGLAPNTGGVDVRFGAPLLNGGSAVTGYKVRHGNDVALVTTPNHFVGGMTAGQLRDFHVRAVNAVGDGLQTPVVSCPALDSQSGFSWQANAEVDSAGRVEISGPEWALPLSWVNGGGLAWMALLRILSNGRVAGFNLAAEDFDEGGGSGPNLTTSARANLSIVLVSGGSSITISGVGDAAEPYSWNPANQSAVAAWVAGISDGDAVTATIRGPAPTAPTPGDSVPSSSMASAYTTLTLNPGQIHGGPVTVAALDGGRLYDVELRNLADGAGYALRGTARALSPLPTNLVLTTRLGGRDGRSPVVTAQWSGSAIEVRYRRKGLSRWRVIDVRQGTSNRRSFTVGSHANVFEVSVRGDGEDAARWVDAAEVTSIAAPTSLPTPETEDHATPIVREVEWFDSKPSGSATPWTCRETRIRDRWGRHYTIFDRAVEQPETGVADEEPEEWSAMGRYEAGRRVFVQQPTDVQAGTVITSPFHYQCFLAHTSSPMTKPGTDGGAAYWALVEPGVYVTAQELALPTQTPMAESTKPVYAQSTTIPMRDIIPAVQGLQPDFAGQYKFGVRDLQNAYNSVGTLWADVRTQTNTITYSLTDANGFDRTLFVSSIVATDRFYIDFDPSGNWWLEFEVTRLAGRMNSGFSRDGRRFVHRVTARAFDATDAETTIQDGMVNFVYNRAAPTMNAVSTPP